MHTFRFPPVIVTLTKRLVYVILFFARPLGVFFFSCGSTYIPDAKTLNQLNGFLFCFPPAKWDGMGWFGVLLAFSEPCMFGGVGFRVDDADGIIDEE